MIITKKDVLKAIRTENLTSGQFIEPKFDFSKEVFDSTCKVCAVGAVLRTIGVEDQDINDTACDITSITGSGHAIPELLKRKDYMSALSCKFESMARGSKSFSVKKRLELCVWVKTNLPVKFIV